MASSAEYTALLGLVGAALAGAAAVVGVETMGDSVVKAVQTGICIVAGDVCRASDAERAGLAPCTVAERTRGEGLTFTVASIRFGADDSWTASQRSDGTVIVTHSDERRLGGKVGIGVEASPLGVNAQLSGRLDYALVSGRAWEFPDPDSARRFLDDQDREDRRPATWRFGDVGAVVGGEAEAGLGPVTLTEFEETARAAAGARVGRGMTTYYVRTRADSFAGGISLPGVDARVRGPSTGDSVVEVTRDRGGPREIAFRRVQRGRDGQVVETVARLDLRDPGNRAAAEPLLAWPPDVARELGVLVARAVRTGLVERAVYDVEDDSEGLELSAGLGVSLGVDASETDLERRLVAAQAWTNGSDARERADCGVTG